MSLSRGDSTIMSDVHIVVLATGHPHTCVLRCMENIVSHHKWSEERDQAIRTLRASRMIRRNVRITSG